MVSVLGSVVYFGFGGFEAMVLPIGDSTVARASDMWSKAMANKDGDRFLSPRAMKNASHAQAEAFGLSTLPELMSTAVNSDPFFLSYCFFLSQYKSAPRPKFPSDQKKHHEQRRPGCAHTIRLPEDLLLTCQQLKRALGARSTHSDVIRFLFEAADVAIQAVLQSAELRVVADSMQDNVFVDDVIADPDEDPGEIAEDSEESDPETMVEAGRMVGGRDDDVHVVNDSQVDSIVTPASNYYKDAVNGFWATVYCVLPYCKLWLMAKKKPGWITAALDLWYEQKDKIQDELLRAGKPFVVYVDSVRRRAKTNRVLVRRNTVWKTQLASRVFS
ncbi:hypothetical protein R1sor_018338 [Riccia sorocarpa]|uniref:Uncharacterized protein n=1 Tax=Riccia sorocarpa TaxID=122646 RepID=A0ABD3IDH2_9MARC